MLHRFVKCCTASLPADLLLNSSDSDTIIQKPQTILFCLSGLPDSNNASPHTCFTSVAQKAQGLL